MTNFDDVIREEAKEHIQMGHNFLIIYMEY